MLVTPFGREIKRLRADRELTVRDLAAQIGKSVAYIGKIESQGEIPTATVIGDLARILKTDVEALLVVAKQSLLTAYEREIELEYPEGVLTNLTRHKSKKERRRMATTMSLINMKGGVGKTTLSAQLAHAADTANLKVLAIDLDPQSNLSQSLMGAKSYRQFLKDNKPSVVQVFEDPFLEGGSAAPHRVDINTLILKKVGYWVETSLDLVPCRLELARTVKYGKTKPERLAKALRQVQDVYDLIIIDCAPTESILTDAAYLASSHVVVPIKPEFMATIGLPMLARSLNEFQAEYEDHDIELAGIVFDHSSSYTTGPEGQQSIKEVTDFAEAHGWRVFENQVRYSASYAKSARESAPIARTSYVRWEVTEGFRKLKNEIFDAIGLTEVAK